MKIHWMELSALAILLATFAKMAIGAIYYSPKVLGETWLTLSRHNKNDLQMTPTTWVGTLAIALVTAVILAAFIQVSGERGWQAGACVGFTAWLGFVATTTFNAVLFSKQSIKLWLLHNGDMLLALLVMGAILGSL